MNNWRINMNNFRDFQKAKQPLKFNKTHLEWIVSLVPLPYYWVWSIFGLGFFLISLIILYFFEEYFTFIHVFLVLSVLIAWQGAGLTWAHKKLVSFKDSFMDIVDVPHDEIAERYEGQMKVIFNDKGMLLSAFLLIAFVHTIGIDYHEPIFQSGLVNAFFNLFYYLAVYILGTGLYAMIMTAWAVHKIGGIPLHVNALFSKNIQSLGLLYSKFTIFACTVYITWGFFHMLVPPEFSSLKLVAWFGSFAILLIAYFVLPQYSIHQMMVKTKKEKVEAFSSQLRSVAYESFKNPIEENISTLKCLLDIQHQLDKMSDWPFSFYEILHIALIIVIPIFVVTLEVLFGVVK
jgi:hypothetical protein